MAVVQPPVTGDAQQDSWAYQITRLINSGAIGTGGTGTGTGGGSGTGPQGSSGFNAATIYLFTRTDSDTAPETIGETLVYDYAASTVRTEGNEEAPFDDRSDNAVWYDFVPDDTQAVTGEYVWTIVIHVADTAATETILETSWSNPALIARPGQDGVTVLVEALKAEGDLVPDWSDFNNTEAASPVFKNGNDTVLGLRPRVYEAGFEIPDSVYNDTDSTSYLWTKNGDADFDLQQEQVDGVTGKTFRVLLINEMDVEEANFNEVFTCRITY